MTAEPSLLLLAARLLLSLLAAVSLPVVSARAETSNVTIATSGTPGPAARLVLAQSTYQAAMRTGDAVMLLAAIRLARSVTLRPPTGWTKETIGEALSDKAGATTAPSGPAAPRTIAILQALAGEDPSLQDLVYDLDAQLPHGRQTRATRATSDLAGGQTDVWRIALAGSVPTELGLIGDGDSPLGLSVTDETGSVICAFPPGIDPGLCHFTPARNGFFSVTVQNAGTVGNSYYLIGS
jgi:hypothetical protein